MKTKKVSGGMSSQRGGGRPWQACLKCIKNSILIALHPKTANLTADLPRWIICRRMTLDKIRSGQKTRWQWKRKKLNKQQAPLNKGVKCKWCKLRAHTQVNKQTADKKIKTIMKWLLDFVEFLWKVDWKRGSCRKNIGKTNQTWIWFKAKQSIKNKVGKQMFEWD